jgi:hypothetical protein
VKQLRELTIMTPNQPGKLAQVLRGLVAAKINLQAIDSSSGYDLNLVRLITSDTRKTARILKKLGYQTTETTVLAVTVLDRPGQLVQVTSAFAKAKVNIEYMYATAVGQGAEALVVLHLSDLAAGERALKALGWN